MGIQLEYDYETANGSIASIHESKEDGDTGMPLFVGSVIHTAPDGTQTRFPHVEWDEYGAERTEGFPEYNLKVATGKPVESRDVFPILPSDPSVQLDGRKVRACDSVPASSLQQVAPVSHGAEFFEYLRLLPGGWFITLTKSDETVHLRLPLHLFLKLYQEEKG